MLGGYRFLLVLALFCCGHGFADVAPQQTAPSRHLVWSDEFNTDGPLDPHKWAFDTDNGIWGNGELEHYTDQLRNARVENGYLVLEAHHDGPGQYSSARVKSRTDFKYGHIEVRAKFPSGLGTWPALWMLGAKQVYGTGLWPDNGEFDIAEYVGREPNLLLENFYTKNFNWMNQNGISMTLSIPDLAEDFHVYALDWSADVAQMSVDGVLGNVFNNPHTNWADWPFDQQMQLILNFALGSYGGDVDDSIFPQQFLIDYVRIYQ